jgi:hypothetical protein
MIFFKKKHSSRYFSYNRPGTFFLHIFSPAASVNSRLEIPHSRLLKTIGQLTSRDDGRIKKGSWVVAESWRRGHKARQDCLRHFFSA